MGDVVADNSSEWFPTLQAIQLANFCEVAAVALVCYDAVLMFPREVKYIWQRPWSTMSALYVIARYLGIALAINFWAFNANIAMSPATYVVSSTVVIADQSTPVLILQMRCSRQVREPWHLCLQHNCGGDHVSADLCNVFAIQGHPGHPHHLHTDKDRHRACYCRRHLWATKRYLCHGMDIIGNTRLRTERRHCLFAAPCMGYNGYRGQHSSLPTRIRSLHQARVRDAPDAASVEGKRPNEGACEGQHRVFLPELGCDDHFDD